MHSVVKSLKSMVLRVGCKLESFGELFALQQLRPYTDKLNQNAWREWEEDVVHHYLTS